MSKLIASIDIGTNSTLLTIAKDAEGKVETIYEAATITRLGEGLNKSGTIKKEAAKRTFNVIEDYISQCKKDGVEEIYIVGTAALRKASNAEEFTAAIKKSFGLNMEIISGKREAELSFLASETDFGKEIVVVDIGGGSTEIILPTEGGLHKASLPLGCVTLYEKFGKSDPISKGDFDAMSSAILMQTSHLMSSLQNLSPTSIGEQESKVGSLDSRFRGNDIKNSLAAVAVAGTATTLAAMKLELKEYNHSKVHGYQMKKEDIETITDLLIRLSIEKRKKLAGLEPERADIILPGALILKSIVDLLGFEVVTISDRGLRWGIIYEKLGLRGTTSSNV